MSVLGGERSKFKRGPPDRELLSLAKTCWRLLTDDNLLCSKLVKVKYCPNKPLWKAEFRKGWLMVLERLCGLQGTERKFRFEIVIGFLVKEA